MPDGKKLRTRSELFLYSYRNEYQLRFRSGEEEIVLEMRTMMHTVLCIQETADSTGYERQEFFDHTYFQQLSVTRKRKSDGNTEKFQATTFYRMSFRSEVYRVLEPAMVD